jgi:hypothetical protein
MNWTAVIQSVVIAAIGALVLFAAASLKKYGRDFFLRRKLRKELQERYLGSGFLGVTTIIRNTSQVELRVREVVLCTLEQWHMFNPVGLESSSDRYAELVGQPRKHSPPTDSFPRVSPLNNYVYELSADFITHFKGPAIGLRITIDYDSYSGRRKILKVNSNERSNVMIRKRLDHFEQEFRNGHINEARRRFHLPPI